MPCPYINDDTQRMKKNKTNIKISLKNKRKFLNYF